MIPGIMSIPEGFASRSCFCLWSSDTDIARTIEDNHKTYLHPLWEPENFYIDVPAQEGLKQFSVCRVLWSLLSYPVGMVAYQFDTIIKVILLAGNFLMLLVSTLSCNGDWRNTRCLIFMDTLAAVGISIIGTIAPPLAYRLDRMTREAMIKWAKP